MLLESYYCKYFTRTSSFNLQQTLDRRYYYYSHFTNEEIEARRLNTLFKFAYVVSGKSRILIFILPTPEPVVLITDECRCHCDMSRRHPRA